MKITPYIHYDLYSNGNFVKSFNSKEDIDKYFRDMLEEEKKTKWFYFDNVMFIKELNFWINMVQIYQNDYIILLMIFMKLLKHKTIKQ